MMRMSIKSRVAWWYAFSLIMILILVTVFLMAAGDRLLIGETKDNLMTVTDRAVEDVKIIGGKMVIDDDISYYSGGAYVVIYKEDGTQISGLVPDDFPEETAFAADQLRKVKNDGASFYVYDRLIENQKAGMIWIRGMTSASLKDIAPAEMSMMMWFLLAVPLLFMIALLGGWLMTKQAFLPLGRIVDTAEEIRTGGDLSQRIGLGSPDDSDEIRRTAAVFDKMLDQIEKDFEAEKQFTNDASHELRTPVAVILAESEYALAHLDQDEEVKESLLEIRNQADHMTSLVSQLLTMARARRDVLQMEKRIADVSLIAEESSESFREDARRRKIRIVTEAKEGCYMECDPNFIRRLMDNLIDNSLKYGKSGGTTKVTVDEEDNRIHIVVEDDGIGISEDALPRIWDRFFREEHRKDIHQSADPEIIEIWKEDRERSAGLGLPMARWIVEAHDGEITVESKPDAGTAFCIWFPAVIREA